MLNLWVHGAPPTKYSEVPGRCSPPPPGSGSSSQARPARGTAASQRASRRGVSSDPPPSLPTWAERAGRRNYDQRVSLKNPPLIQKPEPSVSWILSMAVCADPAERLIPRVPHHSLLTSGKPLCETLTHSHTHSEEAEGRLLGSRWRSVCGAGVRGRSGFSADSHTDPLTETGPPVGVR